MTYEETGNYSFVGRRFCDCSSTHTHTHSRTHCKIWYHSSMEHFVCLLCVRQLCILILRECQGIDNIEEGCGLHPGYNEVDLISFTSHHPHIINPLLWHLISIHGPQKDQPSFFPPLMNHHNHSLSLVVCIDPVCCLWVMSPLPTMCFLHGGTACLLISAVVSDNRFKTQPSDSDCTTCVLPWCRADTH